jgi:hypothetical protein
VQKNTSEFLKSDPEVEEVLEKLGVLDQCLTTITVIDEDKILRLAAAGDISEDDLAKMYGETITWSLPQL